MSRDSSYNTNTIFTEYKDLPKFEAKVPASILLLRNQEVEHAYDHSSNDDQLTLKAKVNCIGIA